MEFMFVVSSPRLFFLLEQLNVIYKVVALFDANWLVNIEDEFRYYGQVLCSCPRDCRREYQISPHGCSGIDLVSNAMAAGMVEYRILKVPLSPVCLIVTQKDT